MDDVTKKANVDSQTPPEASDSWEEQVKNAGDQEVSKKGELIAAALLFLFGAYVLVASIRMPTSMLSGGTWYTAPGVFPAFMGVIMCILSVVQAAMTIHQAGGLKAVRAEKSTGEWTMRRIINLITIIALVCAYVSLLGVIYYRILTFVFLAVSMLIYDPKKTWKSIAVDLIVSAGTTLLVAYAFESLARIPLP